MIYNISAMVVYAESIETIDEEEAIDKFCADCPYDVEANTIAVEQDFDSWWETLDDIEREEYNTLQRESEDKS